jgi:WD40 repeat protein
MPTTRKTLIRTLTLTLLVVGATRDGQAQQLVAAAPSSEVVELAFTPEGETLVGGTSDGRLILWDAHKGDEKLSLVTGNQQVWALSIAADGQTAKTAAGSIRTWNTSNGVAVDEVQLASPAERLFDFSADGTRIPGALTRGESDVAVWDATTGEEVTRFDVGGMPLAAAFSPDGSQLAIGAAVAGQDHDGVLYVYSLADGREVLAIPMSRGAPSSVAFSPDGLTVAAGDHRTVRIWEVATGQAQRVLASHCGRVTSLAFSPDGGTLASGADGPSLRSERLWRQLSEVRQWNLLTGELIDARAGWVGEVHSIAYSPDGQWLARSDSHSLICERIDDQGSWVKSFDAAAR